MVVWIDGPTPAASLLGSFILSWVNLILISVSCLSYLPLCAIDLLQYNAAAEDVGMSEIAISMLPQHIVSRRKKGQVTLFILIVGWCANRNIFSLIPASFASSFMSRALL